MLGTQLTKRMKPRTPQVEVPDALGCKHTREADIEEGELQRFVLDCRVGWKLGVQTCTLLQEDYLSFQMLKSMVRSGQLYVVGLAESLLE